MRQFVLKRLVETLFVLFLALTTVFVMMNLSGDPALLMVPLDSSAEFIQQFRQEMGFNDPLPLQYIRFITAAFRGDFGKSLRQEASAISLVLQRIPASMLLTTSSILTALIFAIPLGIFGAVRRGSTADRLGTVAAVFAQSVPHFWLGLILILIFSVLLRWLPTGGMGTWKHLVLPTITLGTFSAARIARITRSSMIGTLHMDYIRTARAKGLNEAKVLWKHALKNASIPIITITSLQIGVLFGGAVITETIFSWPGLGRLIVQSIYFRDYPTVQAAVFFTAVLFCLVNLMADILYAVVNPEIRFEKP